MYLKDIIRGRKELKKVNELRAGALLSYVNIAITTIIPLLYTPIMLKMLGQSEYGLYSLSNSIISYLSILNFGMGSAVVRYKQLQVQKKIKIKWKEQWDYSLKFMEHWHC